MTVRRQEAFMAAVADAARRAKPKRPRNTGTAKNLTAEGRAMGLVALARVPRCQALRSDGKPCRAVALKGAKRCIKHGGRVEVPHHPHNIRRFLSGDMHRASERRRRYAEGRAALDAMTPAARREFLEAITDKVKTSPGLMMEAARLWMKADATPRMEWSRIWRALMAGDRDAGADIS